MYIAITILLNMSTILLNIKEDKQADFLSLLKELDFVSDVQVFDQITISEYENQVYESENDIVEGKITLQKDFEKEVSAWRKQ